MGRKSNIVRHQPRLVPTRSSQLANFANWPILISMTTTAKKITELAQTLRPEAQESLLHVAEHLAEPQSFYERMSASQQAELTTAITEADQGGGVSPAELETRLHSALAR